MHAWFFTRFSARFDCAGPDAVCSFYHARKTGAQRNGRWELWFRSRSPRDTGRPTLCSPCVLCLFFHFTFTLSSLLCFSPLSSPCLLCLVFHARFTLSSLLCFSRYINSVFPALFFRHVYIVSPALFWLRPASLHTLRMFPVEKKNVSERNSSLELPWCCQINQLDQLTFSHIHARSRGSGDQSNRRKMRRKNSSNTWGEAVNVLRESGKERKGRTIVHSKWREAATVLNDSRKEREGRTILVHNMRSEAGKVLNEPRKERKRKNKAVRLDNTKRSVWDKKKKKVMWYKRKWEVTVFCRHLR